jgi:hypothetical protein
MFVMSATKAMQFDAGGLAAPRSLGGRRHFPVI